MSVILYVGTWIKWKRAYLRKCLCNFLSSVCKEMNSGLTIVTVDRDLRYVAGGF